MLDKIRLATPEEVSSIANGADYVPTSTVVAMDKPGSTPDLAVLKQIVELNPLVSPENILRRRSAFVWALEGHMRLMGVPVYYFNVAETDQEWQKVVEHWGAERINAEPQVRYRRIL